MTDQEKITWDKEKLTGIIVSEALLHISRGFFELGLAKEALEWIDGVEVNNFNTSNLSLKDGEFVGLIPGVLLSAGIEKLAAIFEEDIKDHFGTGGFGAFYCTDYYGNDIIFEQCSEPERANEMRFK